MYNKNWRALKRKKFPWRRVGITILAIIALFSALLTVTFFEEIFRFNYPYHDYMPSPSKPVKQVKVSKLPMIAKEIARIEGYGVKGSPAQRNNNPGNLVYVGQKGAMKVPGSRFAKFKTPQDGFNALQNQIMLDAKRGHTLETFIYKYAPPKENNTLRYIATLSTLTGIPSKSKLINHL